MIEGERRLSEPDSGEGKAEATSEKARSWYDVLEVRPSASPDEIEAAYKRALKIIDGQSVGGYLMLDPEAQSAARRDVEAAFEVLSDPNRRAEFDEDLLRREANAPDKPKPKPAADDATPRRRRRRRRRKSRIADARTEAPSSDHIPIVRDDAPTVVPAPASTEPPTTAEGDAADDKTEPPRDVPPPNTPARSGGLGLKFLKPVVEDAPTEPSGPAASATATATVGVVSDDDVPTVIEPAPPEASHEGGDLPAEGEISGDFIRKLRESRELSLKELGEKTKIRKGYLAAIEDAEVDELPARVYLRGFLTQIARVLRVDKKRLADGYLEFLQRYHHTED